LTTHEAKEKYEVLIDFRKQQEIEKKVTEYIQTNFSFVVFRVDDKETRLSLESKIISTVSLCEDCRASESWLGLDSPIKKIRDSESWFVSELYKESLSEYEVKEIDVLMEG
jgi:hypothetical protein